MGGNETVKFLETLEDNVFRQNYYMVQFLFNLKYGETFGAIQVYNLKFSVITGFHNINY